MQITWKGQSCFFINIVKGKSTQARLVIDPFKPSVGLKLSPYEADIVLVTHDHDDHNNAASAKGEPFVASSPGEYESKGVFIKGIPSYHDDVYGAERGANTIYKVTAEDMNICHLGDIGQAELTSEQTEAIGNIDILFVPVGGTYTVDAKEASHIVSQIEPKLVIPMHYSIPGLKPKLDKVDEFLKVMGVKDVEAEQKLVVKKSNLEDNGTSVTVLKP